MKAAVFTRLLLSVLVVGALLIPPASANGPAVARAAEIARGLLESIRTADLPPSEVHTLANLARPGHGGHMVRPGVLERLRQIERIQRRSLRRGSELSSVELLTVERHLQWIAGNEVHPIALPEEARAVRNLAARIRERFGANGRLDEDTLRVLNQLARDRQLARRSAAAVDSYLIRLQGLGSHPLASVREAVQIEYLRERLTAAFLSGSQATLRARFLSVAASQPPAIRATPAQIEGMRRLADTVRFPAQRTTELVELSTLEATGQRITRWTDTLPLSDGTEARISVTLAMNPGAEWFSPAHTIWLESEALFGRSGKIALSRAPLMPAAHRPQTLVGSYRNPVSDVEVVLSQARPVRTEAESATLNHQLASNYRLYYGRR